MLTFSSETLVPFYFSLPGPELSTFRAGCGRVVNESVLGCKILVYVPVDAAQPTYLNISAVNSTAATVSIAYRLPGTVSVLVTAVDGAGNLAANTSLEWKVDAQVLLPAQCSLLCWVHGHDTRFVMGL